jgi:hypothetical protein
MDEAQLMAYLAGRGTTGRFSCAWVTHEGHAHELLMGIDGEVLPNLGPPVALTKPALDRYFSHPHHRRPQCLADIGDDPWPA